MFRNTLRWLVVFSVLVTMWSVGGLAPEATAANTNSAAAKCAIIKSNTVAGINFSRLNVVRSCDQIPRNAVGGKSLLSRNRISVRFNGKLSPTTQVAKTTLHELTHFVEYKTTPAMRIKLYSYLNVTTDGAYTTIPTVPGTNLAKWKQSARERLAESAVACRFGTNTFPGMKLVPKTKCTAFINTLNQAIAVSK